MKTAMLVKELMPGVQVLSEEAYQTMNSIGFLCFFAFLFGIILIAVGGLGLRYESKTHRKSNLTTLCVGVILFLVFIFCLYKGPVSTTQRYKVLVSDEVSMREFLSHYDIIDQDGEILIVEEKGESNNDTD